jgi:hypothetical protein
MAIDSTIANSRKAGRQPPINRPQQRDQRQVIDNTVKRPRAPSNAASPIMPASICRVTFPDDDRVVDDEPGRHRQRHQRKLSRL